MSIRNIAELQNEIQYSFKNADLLVEAFIHRSYRNEHKCDYDYERLEFLGDSILGTIVSKYLFEKYPNATEGELTKIRAVLVSEKALSEKSRNLKLDQCVYLGKGEKQSGGHDKDSILADVLEALIGAIFIDSGYDSAKEFVGKFIIDGNLPESKDLKTQLQELLKNKNHELHYEVLLETGKDNDKMFDMGVYLYDILLGHGLGTSKKAAEQQAAENALKNLLKLAPDVVSEIIA